MTNASPNTQPTQDPTRVTGPSGTRLVVPRAGGWAIERETGPEPGDGFEETREEALHWAAALVNAKGTPFPPPRRRPSPNENPDALAKTVPKAPVVVARRPLASWPERVRAESGLPVIGKYNYSAEDKPLPVRRSR